jgi:aspartyl-tRNA synthetase
MHRTLTLETIKKIGQKVKLQGWVDTIRNHGKIVFIELRDRAGKVQVVGDKKLGNVHPEDVVEILGTIAQRPNNVVNPDHSTGTVEIQLDELKVLGKSQELPFPIDTDGLNIDEELRLKYRYLDLRRTRLQKNIKLRSQFVQKCREYLFAKNFTEIETPLLTQSTPEGSRDFIVPSRLQSGKFFALPQSPQQYKQLLMTAGFERYFQIAKCFRDEDLRADRGFEHSQLDIEISFITQEEFMKLFEDMYIKVIEELGFEILQKPFPRFTFAQAMDKFGDDKFDLRNDEEKKKNVLAFAWVYDFPMFEKDDKDNWTFTHNPFSMPQESDIDDLLAQKNIAKIKAQQYDLVCNGFEVAGGSIRAHRADILKATYKVMGYSQQEIEDSVGHMLKAFEYGTPPHGGIASGIGRIIMTLLGETALREVQAFPQTSKGTTSVTQAPTQIPDEQLKELGIQVRSMKTAVNNKSVYEQICQYLNQEKVEYKKYEHKPVFTSEEAAAIRQTPLAEGAKALLCMADKKPVMIVLSAVSKLDLKTFKKTFGYKDVSMADKDMLLKVTGLKPGAVPPFGSLFNISIYVDENLTKLENISFNAGSNTQSIQMKLADFVNVEKSEVGKFSK